jgi:hypothetical protein
MDEKVMQIIQEVRERLARMEAKLDEYNNVKEKATEGYSKSLQNEKAIGEIKDTQKWLWRTVVGAIIVAIIGILSAFVTK